MFVYCLHVCVLQVLRGRAGYGGGGAPGRLDGAGDDEEQVEQRAVQKYSSSTSEAVLEYCSNTVQQYSGTAGAGAGDQKYRISTSKAVL